MDFNRASLFNIGFIEALKEDDWDCFIFHDVDLVPENDKNVYKCYEFPRHMSKGSIFLFCTKCANCTKLVISVNI